MDVLITLFDSIISMLFSAKLLGINIGYWLIVPLLLGILMKFVTGKK